MGDIINLNRFRKARKRKDKDVRAARNRASHGRTRAEREQQDANDRIIRGRWEGNRIDPEPTD